MQNAHWRKNIIVSFALGFSIFLTYACHNSNDSSQDSENVKNQQPVTAAQDSGAVQSNSDEQEDIRGLNSLVASGSAFAPGSYAKGSIREGEYIFIGKKGGYFSEELNGQIIDNENFPSFGYVYVHGIGDVETRGYLISAQALKQLGYTSPLALYRSLTQQPGYNFSGTYKGGVDIPAGSYIVRSAGSAYVSVNSGPLGKSDIVWNANFNGTKSVDLESGQYLDVERASIVAVTSEQAPSSERTSSSASADETASALNGVPVPVAQPEMGPATYETSFNCASARSIPEYLICHDADLASADRQLAASVQQAKDAVTDKAAFATRLSKQWNYREQHCRDRTCLQTWFNYQQDVMQKIQETRDANTQ